MKTSNNNIEQAAWLLKAIAHPVRIAILCLLETEKKLTVSEIQKKLNIEQSTASHHLGILKDKGVLSSVRIRKNNFYFIKVDSFENILLSLNQYIFKN